MKSDRHQRLDLSHAGGINDTQFAQMRTQGIDHLRSLLHQKTAALKHYRFRLLRSRFDRNEPHGLARHGLTDGLGVRCICFTPFNEGLDIGRGNKPHVVAEPGDLASLIMGAATVFDSDNAGRLLREEMQHFTTSQPPAEKLRAVLICSVNLKNVLRQIQPDGANLLHGTVPPLWRLNNDHVLAQ